MSTGLRLYNLEEALKSGTEYDLSSNPGMLADAAFDNSGLTNDQLSLSLASTDMDATMFLSNPDKHITGDIGVLVFLEKVQDPSFWDFQPESFDRLMLPKAYKEFAESKKDDPKCQHVLMLGRDIGKLYRMKREMVGRLLGRRGADVVDIAPIVREFSYKMIALDRATKHVEDLMRVSGVNEDILMRTRFFARKQPTAIVERTRALFERSLRDDVPPLNLGVSPEVAYDREVTEGNMLITPIARVNEPIYKLLCRLHNEVGVRTLLVTMNLVGIAKTAVKHSKYDGVIDQVEGGRLQVRSGSESMGPRFANVCVAGAEKARISSNVAAANGLTHLFAMGDTSFGDGPMISQAAENGGMGVVTGIDLERILREFSPYLQQRHFVDQKVLSRIWAVTYA